MAKSKQRAVSILLFLGGILVLVAAWDLPESPVATSEMKSRPDLQSSVRLSLRKRRLIMAQNIIPKGNYFLVGLGIGSLIGVLFAPKSGEETREYLAEENKRRK